MVQAPQDAQLLRIYIDENDQWHHQPLYLAILKYLHDADIRGATVLRGIAGYGIHKRIHTARLVEVTETLPLIIEVIDQADAIERVLPELQEMVQEGLIVQQDARVIKWPAAQQPAGTLRVRDIMTRDPVTVGPDAPVAAVVDALLGRKFKGLPVVDDHSRLVGIITDSDLITKGGMPVRVAMLAAMSDSDLTTFMRDLRDSPKHASEIMTAPIVTVQADMPVVDAARFMQERHLKRLPVLDMHGALVGMLSRVNILRAFTGMLLVTNGAEMASETPPVERPNVVSDIVLTDIPTVSPETPLQQVAELLLSSPLRRVIVVDHHLHVLGIITDIDLVRQFLPEAPPNFFQRLAHVSQLFTTSSKTAGAIMTKPIRTLLPDTTISAAIRQMLESSVQTLPVVDSEDHLLGIVDRTALLAAMLAQLPPQK